MEIVSQCIQISNHHVHTWSKYNAACRLYLNLGKKKKKKTRATDSSFLFSGTPLALPWPRNISLGTKRCVCAFTYTHTCNGWIKLLEGENQYLECSERIALKQVYYQGWNRSPDQVGCMRQVLRAGTLGWPRGMGWRGRWEGGIRMGNTCKSMADSCQCMAKTTTIL